MEKIMEYEYVEDIAEELKIDPQMLRELIERLGIKMQKMGTPPYGVETSNALSHRDAERLRSHIAEHPGAAVRS